jgi:hypothetical protein
MIRNRPRRGCKAMGKKEGRKEGEGRDCFAWCIGAIALKA